MERGSTGWLPEALDAAVNARRPATASKAPRQVPAPGRRAQSTEQDAEKVGHGPKKYTTEEAADTMPVANSAAPKAAVFAAAFMSVVPTSSGVKRCGPGILRRTYGVTQVVFKATLRQAGLGRSKGRAPWLDPRPSVSAAC